MPKCLQWAMLIFVLVASIRPSAVAAEPAVVSGICKFTISANEAVEVEAHPASGFNFQFFLLIPDKVDRTRATHLLVEPNNTGTATDDFEVHRERALNLIERSYPNRIARDLGVPLLVPVFPRPRANWQAYTHALDRDSLEISDGQLRRLDLQLEAMIDHAIQLLRANEFKTYDQVFMHGFSASAKFCNRFAFLHPRRVKAVASGGVNGLPTLPIRSRKGHTLPFPIGIADIETFIGHRFDEQGHQRVAQYVYMGSFDRNDTLPSRDAWNEDEARLIEQAIAARMMPDRWEISQAIYREKLPNAQCVTYNGVAHAIKDEMLNDVVEFFRANSGAPFVSIQPHVYPFVEYRVIQKAHVVGVHWKGDQAIPEFVGRHLGEERCLISIQEWLPGQDHRQLDEFFQSAGFGFTLRAEGHPEIIITERNYKGNFSTGNGRFQAFYLDLSDTQLKALVLDVPYTLSPSNRSEEYVWVVNDGVTLIKRGRPVSDH